MSVRLRFLLVVGLLLGVCLLAILTVGESPKVEKTGLQGEWSAVTLVEDGISLPAGQGITFTLTIDGSEITSKLNGTVVEKTVFKIDETKNPMTMDDTATNGPHEGKTSLSIYEVKGDTLRFCSALPGKKRPTAFQSPPGSGCQFRVFKRVK